MMYHDSDNVAGSWQTEKEKTMYCVYFLQTILCEKFMGMTTAVNLTSVARKMKNLPSQLVLLCSLTSLKEHQAYRYKLKAHQDVLPLTISKPKL